jgi:hypothetical protein
VASKSFLSGTVYLLLLVISGTPHAASACFLRRTDRQADAMPIKRHNYSDDQPSCYRTHTLVPIIRQSAHRIQFTIHTHRLQRRVHATWHAWSSSKFKLRGDDGLTVKSELPTSTATGSKLAAQLRLSSSMAVGSPSSGPDTR